MEIKPLHDLVLIEVADAEATSKGGLILSPSSKADPHYGKVIAVGPGKRGKDDERVELSVAVGDKVAFNAHQGKLPGIGDNLRILPETDLVAILIDSE